jgi:D-threonate/D-erythronate kinase
VSKVPDLGLFMTGGDTALAAVRAVGGKVVRVYSEIEPGIPVIGISTGGEKSAEVRAVTKAGGFGADDTMLKAFDCLKERRCLR